MKGYSKGGKAPQPSGKRGKAPKPRLTTGGTSVNLGTKKPARRGNQGGKG